MSRADQHGLRQVSDPWLENVAQPETGAKLLLLFDQHLAPALVAPKRGRVHDDQPAVGCQHAAGVSQGLEHIRRVVQRSIEDDQVELCWCEGQGIEIRLHTGERRGIMDISAQTILGVVKAIQGYTAVPKR